MKRDINKQIEMGKAFMEKNERMNLSVTELYWFYDAFSDMAQEKGVTDGVFDIVLDAFYMGVAIGKRTEQKKHFIVR